MKESKSSTNLIYIRDQKHGLETMKQGESSDFHHHIIDIPSMQSTMVDQERRYLEQYEARIPPRQDLNLLIPRSSSSLPMLNMAIKSQKSFQNLMLQKSVLLTESAQQQHQMLPEFGIFYGVTRLPQYKEQKSVVKIPQQLVGPNHFSQEKKPIKAVNVNSDKIQVQLLKSEVFLNKKQDPTNSSIIANSSIVQPQISEREGAQSSNTQIPQYLQSSQTSMSSISKRSVVNSKFKDLIEISGLQQNDTAKKFQTKLFDIIPIQFKGQNAHIDQRSLPSHDDQFGFEKFHSQDNHIQREYQPIQMTFNSRKYFQGIKAYSNNSTSSINIFPNKLLTRNSRFNQFGHTQLQTEEGNGSRNNDQLPIHSLENLQYNLGAVSKENNRKDYETRFSNQLISSMLSSPTILYKDENFQEATRNRIKLLG